MSENNWKTKIILFLTAQTISLFGSSRAIRDYMVYHPYNIIRSDVDYFNCLRFSTTNCDIFVCRCLIDRYDRKKMIMLSDGIIAIATLVLAILFLTGYKSIWLLFIVLLIRSAGTGVQTPAVNALIPQIVPKEYLMKVNGINSSITSLIMFFLQRKCRDSFYCQH